MTNTPSHIPNRAKQNQVAVRPMKPGCSTEARRLAEIHESAPAQWIPGYVAPPELVRRREEEFLAASQADKAMLLVAVFDETIAGFHWVDTEGHAAHIKSLWVQESLRRSGLAAQLKRAGEEWARFRGLKEMITSVHFSNQRMLDINIANGFRPGFVQMSKSLS